MNRKIVVLDAGHGGKDPGAMSSKSRMEKNDSLALSKAVAEALSGFEVEVLQTRADDRTLSLAERTTMANSANADLFVSLHRNSYTSAAANGTEIWIYTTAGTADAAAAAEVLERVARVGVQSNRGIKKGNYHVLRESRMTSMLVELGFISNDEDNRLFDTHFAAYADAIAQGIRAVLGVPCKTNTAPCSEPLYRVQVGAFHSRQNAENFLQTVKQMGLDAFLVEQTVAEQTR